jgi:hypothetical protein
MTSRKRILALTRQLATIHEELGVLANYAVQRRLTPFFDGDLEELVEVGISEEGRPIRLIRPAAESWVDAARRCRMTSNSLPFSGFRSIARQTEIIRDKPRRRPKHR